jgi:hypothetical protein
MSMQQRVVPHSATGMLAAARLVAGSTL